MGRMISLPFARLISPWASKKVMQVMGLALPSSTCWIVTKSWGKARTRRQTSSSCSSTTRRRRSSTCCAPSWWLVTPRIIPLSSWCTWTSHLSSYFLWCLHSVGPRSTPLPSCLTLTLWGCTIISYTGAIFSSLLPGSSEDIITIAAHRSSRIILSPQCPWPLASIPKTILPPLCSSWCSSPSHLMPFSCMLVSRGRRDGIAMYPFLCCFCVTPQLL